MASNSDIANFTEQMVRDCRLGSASIFFQDRSANDQRVSYIYHTGVSDEAKYSYAKKGIFLSDPFANAAEGLDEFVVWGAPQIAPMLSSVPDYRGFLSHHDIRVVGAWCRSVTPELMLTIGTHYPKSCRDGGNVPVELLRGRLRHLSSMVFENLLTQLLANSAGQIALRRALPAASDALVEDIDLSQRESEVAALICQGKQNKQVAWMLGISEYTVENHLRRIYRKLGIHSRASLVAHFSRRIH